MMIVDFNVVLGEEEISHLAELGPEQPERTGGKADATNSIGR